MSSADLVISIKTGEIVGIVGVISTLICIAIVGMAYELYKLMCLKNPQKYWGTNKTIFFIT